MTVPKVLVNQIDEALKYCRRITRYGDWSGLARSELTQFALIQAQLWPEEQGNDVRQAHITYATLRWAIERLQPDGPRNWHDGAWRAYLLLSAVYFGDLTFEQVAERVGVSESALYFTRRKAIALLASILGEADAQACRRYVLQQRLAGIDPAAQWLLKALAVFDTPLPRSHVQTIRHYWDIVDTHLLLTTLHAQHFVLITHDAWQVRPEIRHYLRSILTNAERRKLFAVAGEYYALQGDYLRSAAAEAAAGDAVRAARLLLKQQEALLKQGAGDALEVQLNGLLTAVDSADLCAEIHIALGDIAFQQKHLSNALTAYEHALTASSVTLRARAYYKHATAIRRRQVDAALISYQHTIELLEPSATDPSLLLRTYLEMAHLFIQDQHDLEQAAQTLSKATAMIEQGDRYAFAQLHDMQGTLAGRRGQDQTAIRHYLQAYLAAVEVQEHGLMMRVAHNLGLAYIWAERFDEGQLYVDKAHSLAVYSDERQMQATCHKTLGVNYFLQGKYTEAISEYEASYQLFATLGNHNWLAALACDLTEAYAAAGDAVRTQDSYAHANQLIAQTGLDSLQKHLTQITQQYPHLLPSQYQLNQRQRLGYAHAMKHGTIDKRTYAKITMTSPKTAYRDLQTLAEMELLVRVGRGRSTVYQPSQKCD